jgi:hypothetical protein
VNLDIGASSSKCGTRRKGIDIQGRDGILNVQLHSNAFSAKRLHLAMQNTDKAPNPWMKYVSMNHDLTGIPR